MSKRIKLKPPQNEVRLTPSKTRRIDPEKIAKALGAEHISRENATPRQRMLMAMGKRR